MSYHHDDGRARGMRALPEREPLTDRERAIVEQYRRTPDVPIPPAILLPIIDTLADDVARLERTVDQLRAMNRSLSTRK